MPSLTLFEGDCLDVMRDMSANSVDCFICDLPYGCLIGGGGQEKKRRRFKDGKDTGTTITQTEGVIAGCSWDVKIDLEEFWKQVKRLAKDEHTPVLMFCTTRFGYELIASNPSWFRYDLVWDKGRGVSFLNANKMPMRSHEMIYVFSKSGAFYKRLDIEGGTPWAAKSKPIEKVGLNTYKGGNRKKGYQWKLNENHGTRCVKSIVPLPTERRQGAHPTEKPEGLYEWLLRRYCPVGGTVLDPTFGSGNSVFTAFRLGLNAVGIERDEAFFTKAQKRLEALP